MNILTLLYIILVYSISVIVIFFILKFKKFQNYFSVLRNRNNGFDGLRGLLGISVFIHHTIIWFDFSKLNIWKLPTSNFLSQMGSTSVSLFFMLTAFLFTKKIIHNNINNWFIFFKKRFLRLFPLYLFSVLIMITLIFFNTDFEFRTNFLILLKSTIHNFSFYNF